MDRPVTNMELQEQIFASVPDAWSATATSVKNIAPLDVNPALSEYIHSWVRPNATDREKLLDLIDAILSKDGIGLTYKPEATLTANEAFRSGTGNCLGFSNLLVATARDLGLDATYELVNHRLQWERADADTVVGTLHVRVVSLTSASRMVFDFYPLPLRSGFESEPLSDSDALAHHLNNLAIDAMKTGDYALAYAYMYRALLAGPNVGFIWSNLGALLARGKMDDLAEAAYRQSIAISPGQLNALSNLQRLYYAQERLDEAAELQVRLDQHRRSNPYYHASLGDQAYADGDFTTAVEHFKAAIELKKNDPQLYEALSQTYSALGMDREAARAARRGQLLQDSDDPTYRQRRRAPPTGSHISR